MTSRRAAVAAILVGLMGGWCMATPARADVRPTREEFRARDAWVRKHIEGPEPPFSFTYGGRPASEALRGSTVTDERTALPGRRTRRTRTWANHIGGTTVRCVSVTYADYPVVEWTVTVSYNGAERSAPLADLQGIDAVVTDPGPTVLHHWKGDNCSPDSYEPLQTPIEAAQPVRLAPAGGRPSNGTLPYFRVQGPAGAALVAVGWPGQWAASLRSAPDGTVRVTAGQELTNLTLRQGEEVRTPLTAVMFTRGGDGVRAQNLWRRWMVEHNLPRVDGKPPAPILSFCSGGYFEGLKVSEQSERQFISGLLDQRVDLDYWWMDAGWYACSAWPETGTWEPDPARFPTGLKAVSDLARANGMGLVVWFEPERVTAGSWLATNHPDWVLGGALLNLGLPAAREWLTGHVSKMISEQGIDLYRQDFNIDPLPFWRANDAPDRQGMTENLHVQGYLAYWDALLRRHSRLRIDSCASGGRRNDLETMRRAVPLLRSDFQSTSDSMVHSAGNQCHTYGMSSWLPFQGQGVYAAGHLPYAARSYMCAAFAICVDVRKPFAEWDMYRGLLDEWRSVSTLFLGDFYPLMPYSLADDAWMALQFQAVDGNEGMAACYRRPGAAPACRIRMRGLTAGARYRVTHGDGTEVAVGTGRSLMGTGFDVALADAPSAAILRYKRVR